MTDPEQHARASQQRAAALRGAELKIKCLGRK